MGQELTQKIAGLWTFPSDITGAPEGSLAIADNIVIDRDNEAEPRRGFDYLTHAGIQSTFSSPSYRANKLFFYQNFLLSHYATTTLGYHDPTTGWTNYTGTFNPPTATIKVRSAQASQNFYFTTAAGVQKLDSYTGTPRAIGTPAGLDVTTTVTTSQTPTGNTTNTSVNVSSLSSFAGLAVGMTVTGTGIPANTTIVSFTATTMVLSAAATATNSGVTLTCSAPATFLPTSTSTAYRIVWGYTDANQNLIVGAPTQRADITNTTAAQVAITVNTTIPLGITAAHFYQVYRAQGTTAGVTPSEEMGLVYQGNPTANDLTNGFISVVDVTPDALRGTTIYVAPSQGGLTGSYQPVPLCYDLATFRNCMWFANTTSLQRYSLNLLGTGTPTGLQSGDTITIGGVAYTASSSSENTATGQFLVTPVFSLTNTTGTTHSSTSITSIGSTTGVTAGMLVTGTGIPALTYVTVVNSATAVTLSQATTTSASISDLSFIGDSAAQSIRDTALSLVRVINRYASSTVYAFYQSAANGLPGMMLFQGRTVGQAAFPVISSRSTCWSPALPVSGTTQSSTADVFKNGLYYSQTLSPEAVPLGNYFRVGSADKNILRIIALRDSLFVLKEDGIFRISGTDPTNFTIWPLDYTNILIAPESAVALNNQIYALTGQGVVTIGETGVKIMSRPIEASLTSLSAINLSLLQSATFAVAYETARAYYLFTISNATDTGCTQWFRYNTITNAWTRGTLPKTCGGVNPVDDKLYLGNAGQNIIDLERKNLTYSDYADYSSTQVISAVSGTTVTITSSDTILVGSIIYQGPTVFGTVVSADPVAGTVTTSLPTTLVAGNADVLAPIQTVTQWLPASFGNPGYTKHIREVNLLFQSLYNGTGTVGFTTDVSPNELDESLAGGNVGSWGLFAWGGTGETSLGVNWGGSPLRKPARVMVPRIHQRCTLMTVKFSQSYAYSPWTLQGISYIGDLTSERTS